MALFKKTKKLAKVILCFTISTLMVMTLCGLSNDPLWLILAIGLVEIILLVTGIVKLSSFVQSIGEKE